MFMLYGRALVSVENYREYTDVSDVSGSASID